MSTQSIWDILSTLVFDNEASVETRFVEPLLAELGYDPTENIAPKYPVVFQEGKVGRRPEADFVIFANRPFSRLTSLITVEVKKYDEEISGGKLQGESYAANIRTPFLLMTNGRSFQIWQMQLTTESECAVDCNVSDLAANRGKIESLISRESAVEYCKTLKHKSFDIQSRDLSKFEIAEYERQHGSSSYATRRLSQSTNNITEIKSVDLIQKFPKGALIVGPSGFGKTTLGNMICCQALEARWANESSKLPIEVFAPDLTVDDLSIETYLCQRISAHCVQINIHSFRDIIRNDGILVVLDAYDRVESGFRAKLDANIIRLMRDYPNIQIFIAGRQSSKPTRVTLPTLDLLELNDEEQSKYIQIRLSDLEDADRPRLYDAPRFIKTIVKHPLLLILVLDEYRMNRKYPKDIDQLFRTWLTNVLPSERTIGEEFDFTRLLTLVANETIAGPVDQNRLLRSSREAGFSDSQFQSLLESDAMVKRGFLIEISHEGLADYLRAVEITSLDNTEAEIRIDRLQLRGDSQLVPLLMYMSKSIALRKAIWSRVSRLDITAAITCLRYQSDISELYDNGNQDDATYLMLSEILEGIDLPLESNFPLLKDQIKDILVNDNCEVLGITGVISHESSHITYSFRSLCDSKNRVSLGIIDRSSQIFGKSLRLMGLKNDSGRLIGLTHVYEGILQLLKERLLPGGCIWKEEITLSRLRHLIVKYDFPIDLGKHSYDDISDHIKPFAGQVVRPSPFDSGQTFLMDDLISDIDFLIRAGYSNPNIWWTDEQALDFSSERDRALYVSAINNHYLRTQQCYEELVDHGLKSISTYMPYRQSIPRSYDIAAAVDDEGGYKEINLKWKWMPVENFNDAGATVTFDEAAYEHHHLDEDAASDYINAIDEKFKAIGRTVSNCSYDSGWRAGIDFSGRIPPMYGQIDETSVVWSATNKIREDVNTVFRDLKAM